MPLNDPHGSLQAFSEAIQAQKAAFCAENKRRRGGELEDVLSLFSEPRSVLDRGRSSSPRTSSSTLSGEARKDDWASELAPIPAALGGSCRDVTVEDWDSVITGSVVESGINQEQSFMGWVMGTGNENLAAANIGVKGQHFSQQDLSFGVDAGFDISGIGGLQIQSQVNSSFLLSMPQFAEEVELAPLPVSSQNCHLGMFPEFHSVFPNQPQFGLVNSGQFGQQLKGVKSKVGQISETAGICVQQNVFVDQQLFQAAELVEGGNFVSALAILTRLNQQLPSPVGKPIVRTAFYFKDALQLLATNGTRPATAVASPLDVVFKLGAYKALSDVSPIVQFTNFTCIQVMLEELSNAEHIHIIDFDIGIGGHWSSFMQELAARRSSVTMAVPMLKITAMVSPCSHHHLELHLTRENLCEFARGLNIPFEFNVLSLEPTNTSLLLGLFPGPNEAIAVNLPIGSANNMPFPTLLQLVKQLSPKIVVSVEHGSDRSELPFSHHFLNAFQSCNVLLESIDAAGANQDAATKIERFFVQPRIESLVLGHHLSVDKMLPWRSLFANAGFVPVQFSNFTETQAECILKRVQVRGFHVEKRQASLYLCWQRGDLVSVSAWKC